MSAEKLASEFEVALKRVGGTLSKSVECTTWPAPHKPKAMPKGAAAVYVFVLTSETGRDRVLKVGKAGPASGPRYLSHHYNFSAPSTLAKAILFNPILWAEIGIESIEKAEVGQWIKTKTERMNFHLYGEDQKWLTHLEIFLRGKLSPMMEGVQTKEFLA